MIPKLLILAPALSLALVASQAIAQNTGDCRNMLTTSIGLSLESEGFDTSNVCHLTVGNLAVIKSLLTEEGMNSRRQIQLILDRAG